MTDLPRNIVGGVVMALAAIIILLLFWQEIPEGNRDLALVLLGVALGWAGSVVNFHFGSSQGSKDKTSLMATRPTGKPSDPVHTQDESP
tara:strand:+ start:220 stop:486 length:267 start_codon:yes stop_codon:yes gene_type:complete